MSHSAAVHLCLIFLLPCIPKGGGGEAKESLWCSYKGEIVQIISNVAFGLPKLRE